MIRALKLLYLKFIYSSVEEPKACISQFSILFLLPDQRLYIGKYMCIYTHI